MKRRAKLFGMGMLGLGSVGYGYDKLFSTGMRRYSRVDRAWSAGIQSFGKLKFFDDGFGTPSEIRHVRQTIDMLKDLNTASHIERCKNTIRLTAKRVEGQFLIVEGEYDSPVTELVSEDLWPEQCRKGYFQLTLPLESTSQLNGVVIQTAGTGDHGFTRRNELIAKPLLNEHQIGSCILENPFYARRKPERQVYSGLRKFVDLLTLSIGVALEGNAVRDWLIENGFGNVGFTGVSLGGHTAAVCISVCPDAAPCVPAFCWSNSAGVWTRGALSNRINWKSLYQDIRAHPGYSDLLEELGTGLELWASKDKLDPTTLPEMTEMRFTDETDENMAKNYMITLANYFSHLGNYQTPRKPDQTTFITGNYDYFYGHEYMTPIDQVWHGVKTAHLDCGHVDGFITEGKVYRSLIAKMFEKSKNCESKVNYTIFDSLCEQNLKQERDSGLDFIQKTFQRTTISVVRLFERDA